MESSRSAPPDPYSPALTRALCTLIVVLMAGAAVYSTIVALRNYSQIGV